MVKGENDPLIINQITALFESVFWRVLFIMFFLGLAPSATAKNMNLPYSGRLTNPDASPIEGTVDIVVEFYSQQEGGNPTSGPHSFPAVALADGIFQLNISLENSEFHKVFKSVDSEAWIQITDSTHGVTYDRQMFASSPYALKVPVDGATIGWNEQGELELLKDASVTKIDGQKVVMTGATSGQVLSYDASSKTWKPQTVAGAASSVVNGGNTTTGGVTIGTNDTESLTLETNNTAAMTINSDGNVGIGTTSPDAKLSVTSMSGENLYISRHSASWSGANLKFFKSHGTEESPLKIAAGGVVSYIDSRGYARNSSDTADEYVNLSSIYTVVDGQDGSGRLGGAVTVHTSNGSSASSTEKFRISANGNVGIGTTAPTAKLHVSGPVGSAELMTDKYADSSASTLGIRRARGTPDAPTALVSGALAGRLSFRGHNGSDFSLNRASLDSLSTENWDATNQGMALAFTTTENGSTSSTEKMRINHNGNVGIGTTEPDVPLMISSNTANTLRLHRNGSIGGSGISMLMSGLNSSNIVNSYGGMVAYIDNATAGAENGSLGFHTSTSGNLTEKVRILSNGNVGIGTNSPSSHLEIDGLTSIKSSLSIANCAIGVATLDGGPDLSGVKIGDTFVDEDGNNFVIDGVDDSADTLSFSGTCVTNGDDDAFIARYSLKTNGLVGVGTANPHPGAVLHLVNPTGVARQFIQAGGNEPKSKLEIKDYGNGSGAISKLNELGNANIKFDAKPLNGTSDSRFLFFFETSTTGEKDVAFYKGDGSADIDAKIGVDGGDTFFNLVGNVGIGTNDPKRKLHITDALRLEPGAAPTVDLADGDIYVDSSGTLCLYHGGWINLGSSGSCG